MRMASIELLLFIVFSIKIINIVSDRNSSYVANSEDSVIAHGL